MAKRRCHGLVFGLISLLLAATGCGDDTQAAKDAGPAGERCFSPNLTSNDCTCSNHVPGSRVCGQNGIWGTCSCGNPLPDGQICFEGQQLICRACPGEKEGRITRCLAGGAFDCGCDLDAGSSGMDAGSAQDAGHNPNHDAGHDAATGDAG